MEMNVFARKKSTESTLNLLTNNKGRSESKRHGTSTDGYNRD